MENEQRNNTIIERAERKKSEQFISTFSKDSIDMFTMLLQKYKYSTYDDDDPFLEFYLEAEQKISKILEKMPMLSQPIQVYKKFPLTSMPLLITSLSFNDKILDNYNENIMYKLTVSPGSRVLFFENYIIIPSNGLIKLLNIIPKVRNGITIYELLYIPNESVNFTEKLEKKLITYKHSTI